MMIGIGVVLTFVDGFVLHKASPLGLAMFSGGIILKVLFMTLDFGGPTETPEEHEAGLKAHFPLVWFRIYGFEEFKNLYDLFEEEPDPMEETTI